LLNRVVGDSESQAKDSLTPFKRDVVVRSVVREMEAGLRANVAIAREEWSEGAGYG
jgi:hypothetical protein